MEQTTSPSAKASKPLTRSHAYPSSSLELSVDLVKKIYTQFGSVNYNNRETIASLLGLASVSVEKPVSSCVQYGLLEIKAGAGYKPTQQFVKIYKPLNGAEKINALLECFQTPKLYRNLIKEYNGNIVPNKLGLSTQLFRNHHISESASDKAAETFLDNLKFLGLVNQENVLALNGVQIENKDDSKGETREEVPETITTYEPKDLNSKPIIDKSVINAVVENTDSYKIPIRLSNGRTAKLELPENYTDEDLERVIKVIEAYRGL